MPPPVKKKIRTKKNKLFYKRGAICQKYILRRLKMEKARVNFNELQLKTKELRRRAFK